MKKVSVIIPVHNEEKTVGTVINKVLSLNIGKEIEIIVINDGSKDRTKEILEHFSGRGITVINLDKNLGKGAAIREGLKHATGDIVLIQDADLEYNPEEYHKLIEPILKGHTKVVYGSRILNKNKWSYLKYYLGGRLLTFITNFLYGSRITDESTGYKVFHKDVIKGLNLKVNDFGFCPEITAKVLKKGYKIYEIPISYNPRSHKEGKKN